MVDVNLDALEKFVDRHTAEAESRGYARGIEAGAREVDSLAEITMSQPTRNAAEARTKMEVTALLGALRQGIRALLPAPSEGVK